MIKMIVQNEKLLFAAIGVNGSLEYVQRCFIRHQPELTAMLSILQLAIAFLTLAHLFRKWVNTRKKKHEKTPGPPSDNYSV